MENREISDTITCFSSLLPTGWPSNAFSIGKMARRNSTARTGARISRNERGRWFSVSRSSCFYFPSLSAAATPFFSLFRRLLRVSRTKHSSIEGFIILGGHGPRTRNDPGIPRSFYEALARTRSLFLTVYLAALLHGPPESFSTPLSIPRPPRGPCRGRRPFL